MDIPEGDGFTTEWKAAGWRVRGRVARLAYRGKTASDPHRARLVAGFARREIRLGDRGRIGRALKLCVFLGLPLYGATYLYLSFVWRPLGSSSRTWLDLPAIWLYQGVIRVARAWGCLPRLRRAEALSLRVLDGDRELVDWLRAQGVSS